MREIKFRAFFKELGEMLYSDNEDIFGQEARQYGKPEMEIMQYTGLKDKNGKDVYEGDVIEWEESSDERSRLGIVRFGVGTYDSGYYQFQGFYLEEQGHYDYNYKLGKGKWTWGSVDTDGTANTLMTDNYYEVIGNIYENPDLLKPIEKGAGDDYPIIDLKK